MGLERLKTAVQKLEENPVPENISRKITELQANVQLLTPDNVPAKSSVIKTLFDEIKTLKEEKQNKRGVALRQLSESRLTRSNTPRMTSVSKSIPSTPRAQEYPSVECPKCLGKELPTGWTKCISKPQLMAKPTITI